MLNKDGNRELCYVVKIDNIEPIIGRDRVESAVVGGWTIMVRKDQFKPGDLGIYFEIDSKVPEKEPFTFLANKNYKIKTQKYSIKDEAGNKIGDYWSQGLLMGAADFDGGNFNKEENCIFLNGKKYTEGDFLTEELEVSYAVFEDNARKSSKDKYKAMAQRHEKLFARQPFRWLMRKTWGKKLLFLFFGKKSDKKNDFPYWVVKTDEEKIQNLAHIYPDMKKKPWIATEKIDGTSTTFTIKKHRFKNIYRICSRNVTFTKPDQKCFYDSNVYIEMAEKYDIENVLNGILSSIPEADFITIQGETYGAGVQKRDYSIKNHDFAAFNVVFGYKNGTTKRLNPYEMKRFLEPYKIPCVPILSEECEFLPETIEELLKKADGNSVLDGKPREGLVFRDEEGIQSFKAVSNEYLMKYQN